MEFALAPELTSILRPGVAWLTGATVRDVDDRLDAVLLESASAARQRPSEDVGAVRAMYKRIGLDPTKTRPSSEALLRRVRRGDALPRVNTLVDICNWCSLEFQLPYGLYDAACVDGPVTLRLGRPGEAYPGIRKDDVHVEGRIALVDSRGPFGNPTSDSARTMITSRTTRAVVVVFAPVETSIARLSEVLDLTVNRMATYAGCREERRWLPSPV